MAGFVLIGAGCTDDRAVAPPAPVVAQTTIVEQVQIPTNAPPVRDLQTPGEVQALLEEFAHCAIDRTPPGAGLAIWFDPDSGLVGSATYVAVNNDVSQRLDEAVFECDAELTFRPSINAYIAANPRGGKLGPNGLPEDRGRRLLFGDPAVVASLRRTG